MLLEGRSGNNAQPNARYKFTEKERDTETGYDYFETRYYDSRIGLFRSVDPHADSHPAMSPYCYAANNPISLVDPSGEDQETDNLLAAGDENGSNPPPPPKPKQAGTDVYTLPWVIVWGTRIIETIEAAGGVAGSAAALIVAMPFIDWRDNVPHQPPPTVEPKPIPPPITTLQSRKFAKPKIGVKGKEGATDIPSWAEGEKPFEGESSGEFAKRLLDGKYGPGNWKKGPNTEHNRLKKFRDRSFEP